jgi:uncharacterized membrane protein YfcA
MIELFPGDIAVSTSLWLIAISAMTSFITAAAGLGGGTVLLAVMAILMPAAAIIPVHGAVQIGSNLSRTVLTRKHIQRHVLLPFIAGSIVGAGIGGVTVIQLPPAVLKAGLGCFILWSVWGPTVKAAGRLAVIGTGVVSTFLTMFFGATGTFVSAMVKTLQLGRLEHVATQSACMVAQHIIKVVTFGLLGFAYGQYAFLIAAMIFSGFIGVLIGTRLLLKMNDAIFHRTLAIVLTILAVRLILDGLFGS